MKLRALVFTTTCIATTLAAQQPAPPASTPALREYLVDFGHSIVEFSIKFAFTRIKGRFTSAKGTILYDEARPERSSISMVIDTKSLDTGWPHRDEHLRTSDFFDVETYPTIAFQSERLEPGGEGWIMHGKLAMHGVTRDVAIPFHLQQPPTRDPQARWMVLNAAGELRLARADFGIVGGSKYNAWFDRLRAATMGDSVDISLEIEGYSADATTLRSPNVEDWVRRALTRGVPSQLDSLRALIKSPADRARYATGTDLVERGLIATGRLPEALAFGRGITELIPNAPSSFAVYGLALAISGDSKAAASQYARMKEVFEPPVVDPSEKFPQVDNKWYYLDQLVRNALEWGYPKQALPLARTIAELYPTIARAHTTLGTILAATGDVKGAAAAYAKALEVDPAETRAMEWRRRL